MKYFKTWNLDKHTRSQHVLIAALCIINAISPCTARAESQRTRCVNSGFLGKSFAEARDNGMSLKQLAANIENIGSATDMPEHDVLAAKATAAIIYSDLKLFSPTQVQKFFVNRCMKENG